MRIMIDFRVFPDIAMCIRRLVLSPHLRRIDETGDEKLIDRLASAHERPHRIFSKKRTDRGYPAHGVSNFARTRSIQLQLTRTTFRNLSV